MIDVSEKNPAGLRSVVCGKHCLRRPCGGHEGLKTCGMERLGRGCPNAITRSCRALFRGADDIQALP
jgi:hypothetical protein